MPPAKSNPILHLHLITVLQVFDIEVVLQLLYRIASNLSKYRLLMAEQKLCLIIELKEAEPSEDVRLALSWNVRPPFLVFRSHYHLLDNILQNGMVDNWRKGNGYK